MHSDPNAPGFNSLTDLRERLWAVEEAVEAGVQTIDVSAANDGLTKVGNEMRLDIEALPTAPEN